MKTLPCSSCGHDIEFLALDGEGVTCENCGLDCVVCVNFAFGESKGRVVTLEPLTGLSHEPSES